MTEDYYHTLSIPPTATPQQIRDAYKKAALKHHPDRVPADSPERAARTKRFQAVNDAYYTLSDAGRRREYDAARAFNGGGGGWGGAGAWEDEEEVPRPGASNTGSGGGFGSFPWSAFGFGGSQPSSSTADDPHAHAPASEQFGSVFEEMLRDEGMADGSAPTGKFWSVIGGLSGGAMGFIVANFGGMVAGAVAGNRLGSVRDAKGMSVYAVFQEMPQADKARLLSSLAAKVLSGAVSG
ncbi:dnaJ chaperone-like protein [Boeremia exigua]|uniref:dnaJ chaperone-like protein n=1 Tax=Boeremia exigua TaxID=749465 RepID=UPI001E8D4BC2|nr:dnaJ chaperone-like protein [Boeremia exigua]KAH6612426.1 dnaJ chaperone-like protein [Boeremia exigua]